jgi:hypothetical protein
MLPVLSLGIFIRRGKRVRASSLEHGFSNCGTRTATGTPTIVYWYATLKNPNIKSITILKNK